MNKGKFYYYASNLTFLTYQRYSTILYKVLCLARYRVIPPTMFNDIVKRTPTMFNDDKKPGAEFLPYYV